MRSACRQTLLTAAVEPFASMLKGDLRGALGGGEKALMEVMIATHAGMTTDEFDKVVKDWLATAKHPKTGQLYTGMVYRPMLELLAYLRANLIGAIEQALERRGA